MQRPRLRDNKGKPPFELYPLGQLPDGVILEIAKRMAYSFIVGKPDISGEDWGDIFAKAIGGKHLGKPVGLADVVYEGMAWSVKSVKNDAPREAKRVRVVSGRCSPDYSFGIADPRADLEKTGEAVLSIWNERVNIAKQAFEPLRTCVLVRNFTALEFLVFEQETVRYNARDYEWRANKRRNLEGIERATGKHKFTWQPHGAQLTIIYDAPPSAQKFKVRRPPVLDFEKTMTEAGFSPDWVTIL